MKKVPGSLLVTVEVSTGIERMWKSSQSWMSSSVMKSLDILFLDYRCCYWIVRLSHASFVVIVDIFDYTKSQESVSLLSCIK